ncbi:uncharacterized protein LOC142236620 [Haematobia irritans]|uniref:uncharacterized protein LOC142236620 n=1 Tax=Haematobia irritans TaxID=7368 RepID=UPI003F4F52D0
MGTQETPGHEEKYGHIDEVNIYNIPGYNAIHCCRHDGYGGTSLYVRDNLTYTVELCESGNFIEAIRISVDGILVKGIPLKFTSFYRSPKCNLDVFLWYLENKLCVPCRTASIVVGDSNIDQLDPSSSSDMFSVLSSVAYESCHALVSRPRSRKSLDHVYSNIGNRICVHSIECAITDHNIIWCRIEAVVQNNNEKQVPMRHYNYRNITENIRNNIANYNLTGDPSLDMENITFTISDIISENTTFEQVQGFSKSMITPWENNQLLLLRKYKEKLLKRRRKRGKDRNTEFVLKRISRIIKIASKESINSYVSWNLEKLSQNPRESWNFLNKCLGRKKEQAIKLKTDSNGLIVDDKLKCNIFNEYFLNIPNILKQNIVYDYDDNFNKFGTLKQCLSRFSFNDISSNDIMDLIRNMNCAKSPGHDGISGKVLNVSRSFICEHLSYIFNRMINKSTYPEVLKLAKIVPIPKSANAEKVSDFRPIALLPLFDKIYEKLLHKQLSTYFELTGQLYPKQFGFKKGSGTQEAVVNIVNTICDGFDVSFGGVGAVFYDLSKAFDLVDHNILLSKLPYYGICGRELKLLESYIVKRKQYVEINGTRGDTGTVEHGVPQGSVLGPLLFTVYLNDISNLNLNGQLIMYADDIALLYPYNHEAILKGQMEHDAKIISEFCRINKLIINPNKTKLMRFRPRCPPVEETFNITIGGVRISECQSMKYLGIHLQNNLAWNMHMEELKKKVSPAIGMLHKFRNVFNVKTKLLLYNSLIQSHLNYLAIIYAHKNNFHLRALQRTQNKALKIVFNLPILYPTSELYSNIAKTILPVYGIYKFQLLTYMFKATNNIGLGSIQFLINQTAFNTRNNTNLKVKRCRLEVAKQGIEHSGCVAFNRIPDNLKNISRISTFKREIKSFLLRDMEMLLM